MAVSSARMRALSSPIAIITTSSRRSGWLHATPAQLPVSPKRVQSTAKTGKVRRSGGTPKRMATKIKMPASTEICAVAGRPWYRENLVNCVAFAFSQHRASRIARAGNDCIRHVNTGHRASRAYGTAVYATGQYRTWRIGRVGSYVLASSGYTRSPTSPPRIPPTPHESVRHIATPPADMSGRPRYCSQRIMKLIAFHGIIPNAPWITITMKEGIAKYD
eukprot:359498-Rhodomonas_salina.1